MFQDVKIRVGYIYDAKTGGGQCQGAQCSASGELAMSTSSEESSFLSFII